MPTNTKDQFLIDVYGRLYVPLSTFGAHASGFAMLRHVDANRILLEKPTHSISLRILVHTADACTARLAIALAERQGVDASGLVSYGNAHVNSTTHPLLSLSLRCRPSGKSGREALSEPSGQFSRFARTQVTVAMRTSP